MYFNLDLDGGIIFFELAQDFWQIKKKHADTKDKALFTSLFTFHWDTIKLLERENIWVWI